MDELENTGMDDIDEDEGRVAKRARVEAAGTKKAGPAGERSYGKGKEKTKDSSGVLAFSVFCILPLQERILRLQRLQYLFS